eukprot:scaffold298768_cov27-Tisochrysis_lutea.AAC.1
MFSNSAWVSTSKAMDAIGCGDMLDDVVCWLNNEVDTQLELEGIDKVPSLDGIVLDGDATTNTLIPIVMEKAGLQAGANAGYCRNLNVLKCTNHLAKNCGNDKIK